MTEVRPMIRSQSASHELGRKLDSIPFSGYHIVIIAVLSLVGFIEGYDLSMTIPDRRRADARAAPAHLQRGL